MSLTLVMLSLRAQRPAAEYVIWSRIDQKAVLKAILAAGLKPLVVDVVPSSASARLARKRQKMAAGKGKGTQTIENRAHIAGDAYLFPVASETDFSPPPRTNANLTRSTSDPRQTANPTASTQPPGSQFSSSTSTPQPQCIDQLSTDVAEIERLLVKHREKVRLRLNHSGATCT